MKYLFLTLFSFHTILSTAQTQAIWGKCPSSDFSMEKYPQDTTADAVWLYDGAEIFLAPNGLEYRFVYHKRLKILTEKGLERANIAFQFYSGDSYEFIRSIEAQVLQPDGKHTTLNKSDFFKEKVNENITRLRFTFPNIQPGSIVEYRYELACQGLARMQERYFQYDIPVRYSRLKLTDYKSLGRASWFQGLEYMEKLQDGTYLYNGTSKTRLEPEFYEMQNIPAFKYEPYMTTEEDYRAKLKFQSVNLSTWDEIQVRLLVHPYFGGQFKDKTNYKEAWSSIEPLTINAKSQTEKAKIVYSHLSTNVELIGNLGILASDKLDVIYKKRRAFKTDLNLLLLVTLRALKIESYPVLTSTRKNGKLLPEHSIVDQFNDVLVRANLDGEWVLLDVGDAMRPMGYPAVESLNYKGWQLKDLSNEWIDIEMPNSKDTWIVRCALKGNNLVGHFQNKCKGYNAHAERISYREDKTGQYWERRLNKDGTDLKIDSFSVSNYEVVEQDFASEFKFEIKDWVVENDGFLYISPMIYSALKENPFSSPVRYYPIDFNYRFTNQYVFQLSIPEGYEIEQLPEDVQVQLPDKGGSFRLAMTLLKDKIQFVATLDIKRLQYLPSEYLLLKSCYDTMIAKYDDMIVLKKK